MGSCLDITDREIGLVVREVFPSRKRVRRNDRWCYTTERKDGSKTGEQGHSFARDKTDERSHKNPGLAI